jgi:SAM-dependent methyltransferase
MVDDKTAADLYTSGEYATANPTWHAEDSPWKARQIMRILRPCLSSQCSLRICEIGCGVGIVLAELQRRLRELKVEAVCVGYDIAPVAIKEAVSIHGQSDILSFECCDVLSKAALQCDWCLLIDVLEHLQDPVQFLQELRRRGAKRFIVNLPLENSLINIVRGKTDPRRSRVGHLHFWDTYSALSVLERAGLHVTQWVYAHEVDVDIRYHRTTRSIVAYAPRKVLLAVAPRLCVHLLGGASLLARCVSDEPDA